MTSIDQILNENRILITCGTGGVGKTTVSAALGLRACTLGKKVIVVTIDPAKRLATSLGMKTLQSTPHSLTEAARVTLQERFHPQSELYALIPETQKTLENLFRGASKNPKIADKIIQNPIFQTLSKEYSGANEYMALQRFLELEKENYDLLIFDTPPSRNALAFLEAPERLSRFFNDRFLAWIFSSHSSLLSKGVQKVFGILESLVGAGFMSHFFDFLQSMSEIREGFTETMDRVYSVLQAPQTRFLWVTTPIAESLPDLKDLQARLKSRKFMFDGLVLNRSLSYFKLRENEHPEQDPGLMILKDLQTQEKEVEQRLKSELIDSKVLFQRLPELVRDVHSLKDLWHVAKAMD